MNQRRPERSEPLASPASCSRASGGTCSLRNSEVYPDLLDVIEMVCIETESVSSTRAAENPPCLPTTKWRRPHGKFLFTCRKKLTTKAKLISPPAKQPPVPELTHREQ